MGGEDELAVEVRRDIRRCIRLRRGNNFSWLSAFLFFLLLTTPALGADNRPPQWYEVAAGIISIPAGLIGLAYSYLLIKKTRLEARKMELEIVEKERAIKELTGRATQDTFAVGNMSSSVALPVVGILMLRFIILYLLVISWGLVEDVWDVLFGGMIASAQSVFHLNISGWTIVPFIIANKLPKIMFWVLFVAMAVPLFRDVNSALGIDVRHLFGLRRGRHDVKADQEPLQNS